MADVKFVLDETHKCLQTHIISFITSQRRVINYWPWTAAGGGTSAALPVLAAQWARCQATTALLSSAIALLCLQFYTQHTSSMTTAHMTIDWPIEHVVTSCMLGLLFLASS